MGRGDPPITIHGPLAWLRPRHFYAASQWWLPIAAYCYRRSSVVCLSVCLLVTFVRPTKKTEPIEMPFGGLTLWAQATMYWMRWTSSWKWENLGLSGAFISAALAVSAAVFAANGIIQSSITARHTMRPFVKLLWSLVRPGDATAIYLYSKYAMCVCVCVSFSLHGLGC